MRNYLQLFIGIIETIGVIFGIIFIGAVIWTLSDAIGKEINRKWPRKRAKHRTLIPIWLGCGIAFLIVLAAYLTLVIVAFDFLGITFK